MKFGCGSIMKVWPAWSCCPAVAGSGGGHVARRFAGKVVDTHAHWYPEEWISAIEKEGAAHGAQITRRDGNITFSFAGFAHVVHHRFRGPRSAARGDGPDRSGRACVVADHADGVLGAAGVRPEARRDLQRRRVRRASPVSRPLRRHGDVADAGAGSRVARARARGEAARSEGALSRNAHQRQQSGRESVFSGLRQVRGAGLADLFASDEPAGAGTPEPVLPDQFPRQSLRDRRGGGRRWCSAACSTHFRSSR